MKSNAIVLAKEQALLGCGAGQMSRVDSVEIAIAKAGDAGPRLGAGLATPSSPSPIRIHKAAAAGMAAIIQPGGSVRDDEVIAACNRARHPHDLHRRRHFKH